MFKLLSFAIVFSLLFLASLVLADASARDAYRRSESESEKKKKDDPFDFSDNPGAESSQNQYLQTDEKVKIKVEPVERGPVVDRVQENATIYVQAPGAARIELYLQAVDGPYCGNALGEPRLLGSSTDRRNNFPIGWESSEAHTYLKLYVQSFNSDGSLRSRSRSLDLAVSGQRLRQNAQVLP